MEEEQPEEKNGESANISGAIIDQPFYFRYLGTFIIASLTVVVTGITWGVAVIPLGMHTNGWGVAVIITGHILSIILNITYCRASAGDPGFVPLGWEYDGVLPQVHVRPSIDSEEMRGLPSGVDSEDEENKNSIIPATRWCLHCNGDKPSRAHHCRHCNRCVLKMDHHCEFVNNCVGHYNLKFFFLFLLYASICCLGVSVVMGLRAIQLFILKEEADLTTYFYWIETLMIGTTLWLTTGTGCAALGMLVRHSYYILINQTVIESHKNVRQFNVNMLANIKQALGRNPLFWLIPTAIDVDGYHFPVYYPAWIAESSQPDTDT